MNPRIWRFILEHFILPKRSAASAVKYATIWTEAGSPLDVTMGSLAGKLEASFHSAGEDVAVARAMSYGRPSVDEALRSLAARGCSPIVAIPLYPQSAFSTTGAARDKLDEALATMGDATEVAFVESYCREEAYIDAVTETIRATGFGQGVSDRLLFAFHSIPVSNIEGGGTYPEQTEQTARAVADKLGLLDDDWRVGYQSRFDKSRSWLGPSVNAVLEHFPGGGSDLFVVAPNFSIDCLETLYDIDIVLRHKCEDAGRRLQYVPCLNDSKNQIELLKELITKSSEAI